MHPELVSLQSSYNRVIDDYHAGHLDYAQASEAVAQLCTVDGGGWVWSIDPTNGSFLRASPGSVAQAADESLFIAAQIHADPTRDAVAGRGASPTRPILGASYDALMNPPVVPVRDHVPDHVPDPASVQGAPPSLGGPHFASDPYDAVVVGPSENRGPYAHPAFASKPTSIHDEPVRRTGWGTWLVSWVTRRSARTPIFLLVGTVVLFILSLTAGGPHHP